jgi:2-dehydropantoate 2-reductase
MKIAVVGGTGSLGAVWASHLFSNGHDVRILGTPGRSLDAVRQQGLTVTDPAGHRRRFSIPATAESAEIGPCDLVVVLTKAMQTAAAARSLPPLLGDDALVLTLQNGWGVAEILAEWVPADRLLLGVTYHGARSDAPGEIVHTATGFTAIGPYLDRESLDRLIEIAAMMTTAGIPAEISAEIRTEVWKKLTLNSSGSAVAGLTRLAAGQIAASSELLAVCEQLAAEAVSVGQALGFDVELAERIATIRAAYTHLGISKASMLQDIEARRPTEIDWMNGAVAREGDRLGIPTPMNALMTALIHGLESSWR